MSERKWIIASISPTGGTQKVADAIASGFHSEFIQMDLTDPNCQVELGEQDLLMAVLPVYAGRVPQVSLQRLSALKGKGQKAVAVVVYGNREYDDALLELKDALISYGFQVIAAAAFIAEHSVVRSIAAARPDETDVKIAQQFAADVMDRIEKEDPCPELNIPGNTPYVALRASAFHPQASDACVDCGLCAAKCPTLAIPKDAPAQTDNDLCINCLRCVQICPQQARALPDAFIAGATKMLNEKAAGYKTPVIFL